MLIGLPNKEMKTFHQTNAVMEETFFSVCNIGIDNYIYMYLVEIRTIEHVEGEVAQC